MLLNTHRHYNTAVALVLDCFNHSGAQRILELEDDLLLLDGRDRVQDVAGVGADAGLLAPLTSPPASPTSSVSSASPSSWFAADSLSVAGARVSLTGLFRSSAITATRRSAAAGARRPE